MSLIAPDPTAPDPRVRELGERKLLARILTCLPQSTVPVGPGDDAAVLAATDGRVVITTDTMVEGPDFNLAWSSPRQLGWKAMISNLSDIAAMGARATGVVLALTLPGELRASVVTELADGAAAALAEHAPGCTVVGGDLATAGQLMIAVTAFGSLDGAAPVLRSGARCGDVLAVSGPLGQAAAGLELLRAGLRETRDAQAQRLITAQLAPTPDLGAGPRAARAGATAMMDLSDGPLLDADRLGIASGVRINLEPKRFASLTDRLATDLGRLLRCPPLEAAKLAIELQLSGGEEHTMLATFPANVPLPHGFSRIGTVCEGSPGVSVDGNPVAPHGWDPYAATSK